MIKQKDQVSVTEYQVEEKTEPFTEIEKRLLHNRKVFLVGEIDENSIGRIIKELLYLDSLNKESINLYINTDGGDVYEILNLYDIIRFHLTSKVNTIVLGKALSSGTCVAATCGTGKRYAGSNSTFMLHESSSSTSGKASDLEIDVKETKRVDRRVNGLLVKHTKLKKKDLNEKFLKNTYFTSSTALDLGIIDVIL